MEPLFTHSFLPYYLPTTEADNLESFVPLEDSSFPGLSLDLDSEYFFYTDPTAVAPESDTATNTFVNDLRRSTFFRPQRVSPSPSSASSVNHAYQFTNPANSEAGISADSSTMSSPAVRNLFHQYPHTWVDSHASSSTGSAPLYDDSLDYDISYPVTHDQLQLNLSYGPPYRSTIPILSLQEGSNTCQ